MGVFDSDEIDDLWMVETEAKADAAMDWLERNGWSCRDCGTKWDPGYHPATKTDPAYIVVEECPLCGGPPVD